MWQLPRLEEALFSHNLRTTDRPKDGHYLWYANISVHAVEKLVEERRDRRVFMLWWEQ